MKREIKFRGKRKDTGEWIIGNLFIPNMLLRGEFICDRTSFADMYSSFADGDDMKKWDGVGITVGYFHEILPETKGEYTGLKDKKGVDIYESDLIRVTLKGNYMTTNQGVVKFYEGKFIVHLFTYDEDIDDAFPLSTYHEFEVIGNRYENKDLL